MKHGDKIQELSIFKFLLEPLQEWKRSFGIYYKGCGAFTAGSFSFPIVSAAPGDISTSLVASDSSKPHMFALFFTSRSILVFCSIFGCTNSCNDLPLLVVIVMQHQSSFDSE